MNRRILSVAVFFLSSLALAADPPKDNVSVAITSIQEHRTQVNDIAAANEDAMGIIQPSQITLVCRLSGAALEGASKFGMLKITEAVDDVGTNLIPAPDKFSLDPAADNFVPIPRPPWEEAVEGEGKVEKNAKTAPAPVDIDIRLNIAPRNATKITSFKGVVQVLAGGERKDVIVEKPIAKIGKTIDDPALKSAGLTITVAKPSEEDPHAVMVEIDGNFDALLDIKLVDPEGKLNSQASYWADEKGRRFVDVYADGEVNASTNLKIELAVGQKAITVPLEFKDVKLP